LTSISLRGYTSLNMNARRVLLFAGSLWEIVRFFLLISLLAFLLHADGGTGRWVFPWLLLCGSGNLLVGAGGIMLSLFPDKNGGLVGLLRLGKILALFSYALLLISGAMRMAIGLQVLAIGGLAVTLAAVLFAVFVLDLLFLAVLLAWRPGEARRELPAAGAGLAEYTETEAKDFH
jgi:hypothetical protein